VGTRASGLCDGSENPYTLEKPSTIDDGEDAGIDDLEKLRRLCAAPKRCADEETGKRRELEARLARAAPRGSLSWTWLPRLGSGISPRWARLWDGSPGRTLPLARTLMGATAAGPHLLAHRAATDLVSAGGQEGTFSANSRRRLAPVFFAPVVLRPEGTISIGRGFLSALMETALKAAASATPPMWTVVEMEAVLVGAYIGRAVYVPQLANWKRRRNAWTTRSWSSSCTKGVMGQ
jgi:hypothetical protein